MSENNITDISNIENINIDEADLPDVISQQFESIIEIDRRIQEAEKSCAKELKKQQKIDKQHEEQLKKLQKLTMIGIGLALCALIIAIIALLQ